MRFLLFSLFAVFSLNSAFGQNTVQIIDKSSGETVPYANVKIGQSDNQMSNSEGNFTLSESHDEDALVLVSCMGFSPVQLQVKDLKDRDYVLKLEPVTLELSTVNVSKPLTAEQIMAQAKAGLATNYKATTQPLENLMFRRDANWFTPQIFNVEIAKSTGFNKKALQESNSELQKMASDMKKYPSKQYTDILSRLYLKPATKDGKSIVENKINVVKATKLYDETRSTSMEEVQTKATNVILKHLDTTKYYRIKSGWFGSHDTLSLRKDYKQKTSKNVKQISAKDAVQNGLSHLLRNSNFNTSEDLDFVRETNIYEYKYEGAIMNHNNDLVYVISFKPRKSRANFQGKLYISESDFAVVRADYSLYPGRKINGINVKLLLGIKSNQNVSSGTLIYRQNPTDESYYLQYASVETNQYLYLNRPIKFIELTDEDKDVVEFDIKVEGSMSQKTEFLNMSRKEIAASEFESVKDEDFSYMKLKKYDPSIWKQYGAIEPLAEMKQFQVIE